MTDRVLVLVLGVSLSLAGSKADGQLASLVADFTPSEAPTSSGHSSSPDSFVQLAGGRVLLTARVDGETRVFVSSDGTALGTKILAAHSDLSLVSPSGLHLFFSTRLGDPSFGAELWRTDGTEAGTFRLSEGDLGPCHYGDRGFTLTSYLLAGETIFPSTCSERFGLFKSDGTAGGTVLLAEAPVGLTRSVKFAGEIQDLLYMVLGNRLWVTDGTSAGTREVDTFPFHRDSIRSPTVIGGRIFFFVDDLRNESPLELWAWSGAPGSARKLASFPSASPREPPLVAAHGKAYFIGYDGAGGEELWSSNGTVVGTKALTAFAYRQAFGGRLAGSLVELPQSSRVLFVARGDASQPTRLWVNSGTPASTKELAVSCPDGCPSLASGSQLTAHRGRFLFAGGGALGSELWATDGRPEGTRPVIDLCPGSCSGLLTAYILGEEIFFWGFTPSLRSQLWQTDGTLQGTTRVTAFDRPQPFSSKGGSIPLRILQGELGKAGEKLLFRADDGQHGSELWATSGIPGSEEMLADLRPRQPYGSSLAGFSEASGGVVFLNCATIPDSLWVVKDDSEQIIRLATVGSNSVCVSGTVPSSLAATEVGGKLYFRGGSADPKLWVTDGTVEGTRQVVSLDGLTRLSLAPGPDGHQLYFAAQRGNGTSSLWRTDGTAEGTVEVVANSSVRYPIDSLSLHDGALYFFAGGGPDAEDGVEVWRSDGTAEGTEPMTQFGSRYTEFYRKIVSADGSIYFAMIDSVSSFDVYRLGATVGSEGLLATVAPPDSIFDVHLTASPEGVYFLSRSLPPRFDATLWFASNQASEAEQVLHFTEPPASGLPYSLVVAGSKLFLPLNDGEHGFELWATDGTGGGTHLVKDVASGPDGAAPAHLVSDGNRVFFTSETRQHGRELWVSDGSEAGTRLVQDLRPGAASSEPAALAVAGRSLFFVANDGLHGREPWRLALDALGCVPSASSLCLQGGRFKADMSWRDFAGRRGFGTAVPLTPDTGYFWFFNPANVETIVKVLDGSVVNDHFWTFYGALSNVEYNLTVTDAQTGESKRYFNPLRNFASVGDTEAFGPRAVSGTVEAPAGDGLAASELSWLTEKSAQGSCAPSSTRLCLRDGRFAVEASWRTPQGQQGVGMANELTADTGYFWFFRDTNIETVVKVLDGSTVNGNFWVFYGALSNVEYDLVVTDTVTGATRTYHNPQGRFASVGDTAAF